MTHIDTAQAVAMLAAVPSHDPTGHSTPQSIAEGGDCYRLQDGDSDCVFVLKKHGGQLWIDSARAAQSKGLTGYGFNLAAAMAQQYGCQRVAFQTGRPGLVKLARKNGFKVVGFIMEKNI